MNIIGLPALVGTYDNYIWVLYQDHNAWVIDPGQSQPVLDFLKQNHLTLQAILVTHNHFDHTGGISDLKINYPHAIVYGPAKADNPVFEQALVEEDCIKLTPTWQFTVMETPGHTLDHISFVNGQTLFCGDTLFTAGCGRLLGGTAEQYSQSILKLRQLPDHLQFYSAHEYTLDNLKFAQLAEPDNTELKSRILHTAIHYPANHIGPQSTLGEEKATNPFMRFDTPALKTKLIQRGATDNAASLFKTLREWKDICDRSN